MIQFSNIIKEFTPPQYSTHGLMRGIKSQKDYVWKLYIKARSADQKYSSIVKELDKEWKELNWEMEQDPAVIQNPDNSPAVQEYGQKMEKLQHDREVAMAKIHTACEKYNTAQDKLLSYIISAKTSLKV